MYLFEILIHNSGNWAFISPPIKLIYCGLGTLIVNIWDDPVGAVNP